MCALMIKGGQETSWLDCTPHLKKKQGYKVDSLFDRF